MSIIDCPFSFLQWLFIVFCSTQLGIEATIYHTHGEPTLSISQWRFLSVFFIEYCNITYTLDITRSSWTHGCAWDYNTDDYWYFNPEDATHNGLAHVESQCDNHFDCDVMINDSLTWCFTSNDYDVQLTYTEYYRCGWGWQKLTCAWIVPVHDSTEWY
jgi:hypothetical protein